MNFLLSKLKSLEKSCVCVLQHSIHNYTATRLIYPLLCFPSLIIIIALDKIDKMKIRAEMNVFQKKCAISATNSSHNYFSYTFYSSNKYKNQVLMFHFIMRTQ